MPSPGRVGAARALVAIEAGSFSDDALEEFLVDKDRELGWFLCLGVLRRQAEVDAALRPFLRQPLAALDAEVRACLRMGTFEKLYARTAQHAVVHETVDVVKRLGMKRASGLVNAVLRRVKEPTDLSRSDRLNLPSWLLARWDERYGADATEAWATEAMENPPLVVVCTDAQLPEQWKASGLTVEPARVGDQVLDGAWRIEGMKGPVQRLAGWEAGHVWVQDAAAVAVADLCRAGQGTTILDACAAPGGKTLRLASQGAKVVAADRSEDRLVRLDENLVRTGMVADLVVQDWNEGPGPDETFEVVLVDAPCTALGTFRRSPEVKWHRQELDLGRMAERQLRILESCSFHVAPGGVLVYAVCSPEPEEGEDVVAAFCKAHPEFRRDGGLHTAPPTAGEDAHTAFRLVREAASGDPS